MVEVEKSGIPISLSLIIIGCVVEEKVGVIV
jgi:hypothetical protein